MTDDADELDAVAVELLALAPAEFTAARNARARAAPKAMAERITALRRPSVSAWAVDLLARDHENAHRHSRSVRTWSAQSIDVDGQN